MKIGDAGEAFFVFETEGNVPEDLITSPLLEATKSEAEGGEPVTSGKFGTKDERSQDSPGSSRRESLEASCSLVDYQDIADMLHRSRNLST